MSGIILLLYLFLLVTFLGGLVVIIYHLLTFRLNPVLARFTVTLLLVGSLVLLSINLIYFSKIDWPTVLSNF